MKKNKLHKRFTSKTSLVRIEIKFGSIVIDKQLPVADLAINTGLRSKSVVTRDNSELACDYPRKR